MKKMTLVVLSFVLASQLAFAEATPPAADAQPCKALEAACEAAGFVKGGHKSGKGLFKDCLQPLLHGRTPANVTVNPADVQACQAKKAQHGK